MTADRIPIFMNALKQAGFPMDQIMLISDRG